ncbi:MAG: response regulator with CheY-like receiver, AAA-type ATPase, and DNA-binding domain [Planctomycetota bacterium]|nr:response regulator with CheY-like receiver, AAA-type ATPase, and DNA-binding domain [Planctomycetota bacterium]
MATLVLADDDDDLRDVYASALRGSGHVVFEAIDGQNALDVVREVRPALLLLDLWMPNLTGFDVLDALRYDPAGTRLKIVVVSNLSDADSRLEAFEAGATAYLVKGRSLFEMIALVERTLLGVEVVGDLT